MSRTPRCQRASMTALPIAAGAPIAPLSLAPLTPQRVARRRRYQEVGAKRRNIRRAWHGVIHERAGEELAGRIVDDVLAQGLADALGETAVHLAFHDHRVDDDAAVIDCIEGGK